MSELVGRRLPDGSDCNDALPGDYWRPVGEFVQPNEWWLRDPLGACGRITKHAVVEHTDGTITVSPSILCDAPGQSGFHGWLKAGVWTW